MNYFFQAATILTMALITFILYEGIVTDPDPIKFSIKLFTVWCFIITAGDLCQLLF
jgi:hypothetical protein